jgi:hypothetical protein
MSNKKQNKVWNLENMQPLEMHKFPKDQHLEKILDFFRT